ncbi:MAG TPA: hypothetical protein VK935_21790 [Actinomycetospora sp.]|nr:hypothetical protein [Actinomycetospora sp.]
MTRTPTVSGPGNLALRGRRPPAPARSAPTRSASGGALPAGLLPRLVLPSPNGSAICALLAGQGVAVVGASLRNRRAVGRWLRRPGTGRQRMAVNPWERWPDGSLRPAIEDLWGAGGLLGALVEDGRTGLSPEARTVAAGFDLVADDVAAELDRSSAVPVLVDGVFVRDER